MFASPRCTCWLSSAVVVAASLLVASPAPAQWSFHGTVDTGCQSDAVVGPNDVIHFVASRYRQFDFDGNELVSEPHGDAVQFSLGFAPAIAVGDDGSAHVLTRQAGSLNEGYDITYERRTAGGAWDRHYIVGSREVRNYIVTIGWAADDQIYATYTQGLGNVWTDLHMFRLGASSATEIGVFHDISRVDTNSRMATDAGRVFLASGKCDPHPWGRVYVLQGDAGSNLVADMTASRLYHSGAGRLGGPDVDVDDGGDFHLLYGAADALYYNRYSAQGQKLLPADVLVLDGLEEAHAQLPLQDRRSGLGAIAASDDGQRVLVVGLALDTPTGYGARLVSALSSDGGTSFGPPVELGRRSNSGEGRQAPRLVSIGKKFFLFFLDDATGDISLGIFTIDEDGDGFEATVDCDDADAGVSPGAEEICDNGRDDNCDGAVDEGCAGTGGGAAGGAAAGGAAAGGGTPGGSGGDGADPSARAPAGDMNGALIGGCTACSLGAETARHGGYAMLFGSLLWGLRRRGRAARNQRRWPVPSS